MRGPFPVSLSPLLHTNQALSCDILSLRDVVLGCRAMPAPTVLPQYCPTQSHILLFLTPWSCLAASNHPGISPALSISLISKGSIRGFDVFPDWKFYWQAAECPYQKTPTSPCPFNVTDDMYTTAIIVLFSRGIAHLLPPSTCV